jgi:hypothetical protein
VTPTLIFVGLCDSRGNKSVKGKELDNMLIKNEHSLKNFVKVTKADINTS